MLSKFLVTVPNIKVNAKYNEGCTTLHLAAPNGNIDTVKFLVSVPNIEVNAVNNEGCTALHLAAQNGHLDTVELLTMVLNVEVNAVANHDTVEFLKTVPNIETECGGGIIGCTSRPALMFSLPSRNMRRKASLGN